MRRHPPTSRGPRALAFAAVALLAGGAALNAYALLFEANATIGALRSWQDPAAVHAAVGDVLVVHGMVEEKSRVPTPRGDALVMYVSDGTGRLDLQVQEAEYRRFHQGDWVKVTFVWSESSGLYGAPKLSAGVPHEPFLAAYAVGAPLLLASWAWRRVEARAEERARADAEATREETTHALVAEPTLADDDFAVAR